MESKSVYFDYYYIQRSGLIYNHINQFYEYNGYTWDCFGGCSNFQQNDYNVNTLVIKYDNDIIKIPITCNEDFFVYKLDTIMNNFNGSDIIDLNEIKKYIIDYH